ncbi:MAG: hypothetical protein ACLPN5_14130 [Roseiarcus sp.]
MAIFAILMPTPQPSVIEGIKRLFPDDYLALNETQYLVSSAGTAEALTIKLGMGPQRDGSSTTGSAVVFKTSSYYGRAPTAVWDWMKAKLEAPPSGG